MFTIHIANQQRVMRVNRPRLVELAESTLASERVRAADISVALVDNAQIHEINRNFLGHDYPTDVISFLLELDEPRRKPKAPPPKPPPRGTGKTLGGEIIISTEYAVASAADYGWRPINELSLYLVHGLLHLCGYDDLTPGEQRVMRQREVEVLAPWEIVPSYAV